VAWPTTPEPPAEPKAAELQKDLFGGQLQDEEARLAWERTERTRLDADTLTRSQAAWAAEYALEKSIQEARIAIAKGGIDRGTAGAEFVRNAAAAIATVYTGVLGATYASADKAIHAPARAIIPAIFLGLALASAAAYVAYLTRVDPIPAPEVTSSLRVYQERRIATFIDWVTAYALNRAYWLHAAVLSLAFGVALLPAPFIAWSGFTVVLVPAVCLLAALGVPLATQSK
jgi:hypothetical protein